MKTIQKTTPVNRLENASRLPFALTLAAFVVAIGCGDKPESPQKGAAEVSSEWTPVNTPKTPAETPAPGGATAAKAGAKIPRPTGLDALAADDKRKAEILAAAQSAAGKGLPPGPSPAQQALRKQGQAMNTELEALVTKLRATHEKAMKGEAVLAKKKLLDDAVIKEIAKIHPGIDPEWKRLQALIKELENNQELAVNDPSKISEATRAKFSELQTLSQKIEPLQMKVIDLPEIKKLRDDFADIVDAEVNRLDPQSEKLTARFEELSGKLTAMQKEFMELQRKSMPPAPSSALPPVPSPSPQPK